MLRSYRTEPIKVFYFFAFSVLIVGLPWSRFLMSVSQFILSALFLFDSITLKEIKQSIKKKSFFQLIPLLSYLLSVAWQNFRSKFLILFRNKIAMVIISLYLMHVIGIIYTSDYSEYLEDVRIKLPLFLLPLFIFSVRKFDKGFYKGLLLVYVFTVVIVSLFSTGKLYFNHIEDLREITKISHIRFSLNVCLAFFISLFLFKNTDEIKVIKQDYLKIAMVIACVWLIVYLFILKSLNGIIIFLLVSGILLFLQLFKRKPLLIKMVIAGILIASVAGIYFYISHTVKQYNYVKAINFNDLDSLTARGNPYIHDTVNFPVENGTYTGLYISRKELRSSWNKRSKYDFNGKDDMGQNIKYTIIRFLSSLGYRKDADGVNKLTDEQVHCIEHGIANVNFNKKNIISSRIYEILWGINNYRCNRDPNGSSIMQRYEYWKTSLSIIKKHWLIGVGSGDLKNVFNEQYKESHSKLLPIWWQRSHNQFLRITAAFGIIGFIWFMISLIYPPVKSGKYKHYLYQVFFMIAIFSMLSEDTLETQAGVTFFAFFNSFFIACF